MVRSITATIWAIYFINGVVSRNYLLPIGQALFDNNFARHFVHAHIEHGARAYLMKFMQY